ncbi:MAG: hypothetical protein MAG431_02426 [Chloroflexi bacterium]|nr:hypothetical protein [Chloroflexota bacterium]
MLEQDRQILRGNPGNWRSLESIGSSCVIANVFFGDVYERWMRCLPIRRMISNSLGRTVV